MSAGPSDLLVSAVYVPGVPKVSVEPMFLHLPACSVYQPTYTIRASGSTMPVSGLVCVYMDGISRECACVPCTSC